MAFLIDEFEMQKQNEKDFSPTLKSYDNFCDLKTNTETTVQRELNVIEEVQWELFLFDNSIDELYFYQEDNNSQESTNDDSE